jgi:hypothetical protein
LLEKHLKPKFSRFTHAQAMPQAKQAVCRWFVSEFIRKTIFILECGFYRGVSDPCAIRDCRRRSKQPAPSGSVHRIASIRMFYWRD